VNNSLVDMYSKCSHLDYARNAWDEMLERDEVSWNSMISGYVSWGEVENARELFEEMPLRRNMLCWTALINGYGKEGNLV
jgi:pentatricopeptide repeat protein